MVACLLPPIIDTMGLAPDQDSNADGQLSADECVGFGADNLMFPTEQTTVGPALIELSGTTVVVPPDYNVRRDRLGSFILEQRSSVTATGRIGE